MINRINVAVMLMALGAGRAAWAQNVGAPAGAPTADAPALDDETRQLMESGPRGTLAVRGIQGTKGAPPIGVCEVEINLLHQGRLLKRVTAKSDEQGQVVVADLPIGLAVKPLVRIKYDNVLYQDSADTMDETHPATKLDIYCYQTTESAPSWRIVSRQIAVVPEVGAVSAIDSVTVDNPSDKTWLGGAPAAENRRPVVVFSLPAGAMDVTLGNGFHGWCCTAYDQRVLTVQMPLMPGRASYRLLYRLPLSDGKAGLVVSSPAPTDELLISVPDDRSPVDAGAMTAVGVQAVDGRSVRLYRGDKIGPGVDVGLVLTPTTTTATPVSIASTGGATPGATAQNVLIGVVGVVAIGGGAFAFFRANRRARASAARQGVSGESA